MGLEVFDHYECDGQMEIKDYLEGNTNESGGIKKKSEAKRS